MANASRHILQFERDRGDYIRRHMADLPQRWRERMPHGVHPRHFADHERQIRQKYAAERADQQKLTPAQEPEGKTTDGQDTLR